MRDHAELDNSYTITIGSSEDSTTSYEGATVGGISPTFTITGDSSSNYTFDANYITDFSTVDYATRNILEIDQIEEMGKDYPSLKIAYEKFKHVYDLVYQDWKGKQEV